MIRLCKRIWHRLVADYCPGRLVRLPAESPHDDPKWPARYSEWIRQRVGVRGEWYPRLPRNRQPSFDIVTLAHNTPADILWLTAASVRAQDYDRWRWIILDNGSTRPDTRTLLRKLRRYRNIVIHRSSENLGITRGHAKALRHCRADYVALLDHDDLLYPDALRIAAWHIEQAGRPPFLYSDEDKADEAGRRFAPFFKPDWSPAFLQSAGYTCHLSVFRRDLAGPLALFSDRSVEGAQDWDLALRFHDAGEQGLHIPEVLYSWRVLPGSTAGQGAQAKPFVTAGQKACVEASLRRRGLQDRFAVQLNPNYTGLEGHWHYVRSASDVPVVDVISIQPISKGRWRIARGRSAATSAYACEAVSLADGLNRALRQSVTPYVACVPPGVENLAPDWVCEGVTQLELNPGAALVGGRVLDGAGRIVAGAAVLGLGGVVGTAYQGQSPHDDFGYFGWSADPHNVSVVHHVPWLARRTVLVQAEFDEDFPEAFTLADLCLRLRERGWQIVYSPHMVGRQTTPVIADAGQEAAEATLFLDRHSQAIVREPYYPAAFSRQPVSVFQLPGPAEVSAANAYRAAVISSQLTGAAV